MFLASLPRSITGAHLASSERADGEGLANGHRFEDLLPENPLKNWELRTFQS
jgi:hypothetical protein